MKTGVNLMSSALTFYFKEIFPKEDDFITYLIEYDIVDVSGSENLIFAKYIYKVLFRQYCNSNIQYDTPDEFKCDLANILEDSFDEWKKQLDVAKKTQELTDDELLEVTTAISNSANNPNTKLPNPKDLIEYVGAQVSSFSSNGKLVGYVTALSMIPTHMIGKILKDCGRLFKTIIPNQIFIY